MNELIRMSAREIVGRLRRGEISPLDLIDACVNRIEQVDSLVNALPTLCVERARDHARRLMESGSTRTDAAWLGGLPIVVKDLNDVAGVRTTYGSPLYADNIPSCSDIMVERLENNGAVVIAKANAPEFGHGANTFNPVFGTTLNPWNTELTSGGSSGGSAVALATGQAWLATGSDFGCSLRTPAAFCSVVGLRPSPGRIARNRTRLPFDNLWVQGPMARSVADLALMLDAMVGNHPRDPISFPHDGCSFLDGVERPVPPKRIAFSLDLGGLVPIERKVESALRLAIKKLESAGFEVEEACPDLRDASEIFDVLRANQFVGDLGDIIEANKDSVRIDLRHNFERGLNLTIRQLAAAEIMRGTLYDRAASFFDDYDLLLTPATIVAPFDAEIRAIKEVNGHHFSNYYDWYRIAFAITLTSLPALSLPCGFTDDNLPVGMQIVGRPRGEGPLLSAASLFETVFDVATRVPIDPIVSPMRSVVTAEDRCVS